MKVATSVFAACVVALASAQLTRMSYRTLTSGNDDVFGKKEFFVFDNAKTLQAKLDTLKTKPRAADLKVNWKKEKVVVIAAGQIPTSGYSIAIQHLERDGAGLTTINALLVKPRPELRVQAVLTYPYVIIAIPRSTGKLALNWVP